MNRAPTDKHSRWRKKKGNAETVRGTFDRKRYWCPQVRRAWTELGWRVWRSVRETEREAEASQKQP